MTVTGNHFTAVICAVLIPAFSITAGAQETKTEKDIVYIEASPWNSSNPDKQTWNRYPSRTVDALGDAPSAADKVNRYGSLDGGPLFKATGFFRTDRFNDRWVLVDPEGHMHLQAAVVSLSKGGGETNKAFFSKKFKDDRDWIVRTVEMLASYGFNGAGSWSDNKAVQAANGLSDDRKFSYCPMLNLMSGYGRELKVTRQLPGNTGYPNQCILVFDPGFEKYCEKKVPELIAPFKGDPDLLGYYSDNEMPVSKNNLEGYLALPEDDYGHKAAARWLREKGIPEDKLTDEIKSEFAGYVANEYYRIVSTVLKKYDPDHMYLGSRLHGGSKNIRQVIQAAGRWCDVISINYYGFWSVRESDIRNWESWTDKPFTITEFYTKAEDSGLSNATGAGWTVHTQKDRGIHYENFILGLLESNNCVGWTWFKYQDNDPTAKGVDPSNLNSNKGIVNNEYEPYKDLVTSMDKVNSRKYALMMRSLKKAEEIDRQAFQSADFGWHEVAVRGKARMEAGSAIIQLFGGPRCISVIRYPANAFRTSVVSSPGPAAGKTSALAQAGGAIAAINGSYFNVKELTPVTFVKDEGIEVGVNGMSTATRQNAMLRFKGRKGHRMDILTSRESVSEDARRWREAITSGPVLLEDGKPSPVDKGSFFTTTHPRSMFGYTEDGIVYMIVIDGRYPGVAEGASIHQMELLAQWFGLHEAMNFDGGGSSTLWNRKDGVINHPCDNKVFDHAGERTVPNIIAVF